MGKNFYSSISEKYRTQGKGQLSKQEVQAYLQARMPATQAAVSYVLKEVALRVDFPIESLLDLGAGPGTGALAAQEIFSEIKKITLVEKNEEMIEQGKELVDADWIKIDLLDLSPTYHDLSLFAYSFGEIPSSSQMEILKRVWDVSGVVVIVEPGTPRGFEAILKARNYFIENGGYMVAPCPHIKKCPMMKEKWCHFSVRLERSKAHRQLKGGHLGWEDEKFSYIACSKTPVKSSPGRIVGHPRVRTEGVALEVCVDEGLLEKIVQKKQGALYKTARKSKWGDSFSLDESKEI